MSTASHSSSYTNKYTSDSKLEFFCNLNLIPTPLLKDCPNTTRNWLKMSEKYSVESTVSINHVFDFDAGKKKLYLADMNFNNEDSQNFGFKTTGDCNQKILRESDCDSIINESILNPRLFSNILHRNISIDNYVATTTAELFGKSKCKLKAKSINDMPPFKLQMSQPSHVLPISHKLALSVKDQSAKKKKYAADVPKSTEYSNLYELVLQEISTQDINQTIFSKTVINKSQGYLSDILRTNKKLSLTKVENHLSKIKNFLNKPTSERQRLYRECISESETASTKPLKKLKRTLLLNAEKELLLKFYTEKKGMLKKKDLEEIASTINITAKSVKIFYKNMKQRNVFL